MNVTRYTVISALFFVSCLLALYCNHFLVYNYPYIEQMDIFMFEGDYAYHRIMQPGGAVSYLTAFVTQFFHVPLYGAVISALIFLVFSLENYDVCKRISGKRSLPFLYMLPGITQIWMQCDFNYHWEGTLGMVFSVFLFNLYIRIRNFRSRYLYIMIISPIGYLLAGPAVFVTVAGVLLYELFGGSLKEKFFSVLIVLWTCVLPYVLYRVDIIPELRLAFTFDAYYHSYMDSPLLNYIPALAFLLNVILSLLLKNRFLKLSEKVIAVSFILQILVLALIFHKGVLKYNDSKNYSAKVLDYYTRTGQWESILSYDGLRAGQNLMHACYQNLALSHLGKLDELLFKFNQSGVKGVVIPWNKSYNSSIILSDVFYQMGNIALSQNMAFEGIVGIERAVNPRLIMRLVQTNLILGHYKVAEKYIEKLSHTIYYKDEAEYYRKLVNNPALIEKDADLFAKRKCLTEEDILLNSSQFVEGLYYIVKSCPDYEPALQYLGAMTLLAKNMPALSELADIYSRAKKRMPVYLQESLIIMYEGNEDKWREYNLDEDVINRFRSFYSDMMKILKAGGNPAYALKAKYGDSYWYYFLFSK